MTDQEKASKCDHTGLELSYCVAQKKYIESLRQQLADKERENQELRELCGELNAAMQPMINGTYWINSNDIAKARIIITKANEKLGGRG